MDILLHDGDATIDGEVTFADFLVLRDNWLRSDAWWQQGDFTADRLVNHEDLALLLAHLSGLTGLRMLALNRTGITDAGLAHLEGMTELRSLLLEFTQVTDAGLVHLSGLRNLKGVWLTKTRVSEQGIAELKRTFPGVSVGPSD